MATRPLTHEICRECQAPILASEYSPHPLEKQATGMAAYVWDYDGERERFIGWICQTCARALTDKGQGSLSGCDGMIQFMYE
jgi:hypothetical protein